MNIKRIKQINNRIMQVILLLMVMLFTGCSTLKVGRDFDMRAFEAMVKVGKTLKAQVLVKMGAPKSKGISLSRDGERLVEWLYFYATGKLSGMDDAQLKILQMRFDQRDILRRYNWTSSH